MEFSAVFIARSHDDDDDDDDDDNDDDDNDDDDDVHLYSVVAPYYYSMFSALRKWRNNDREKTKTKKQVTNLDI